MNNNEAAPWIAANKFGLGMKPGEVAGIAGDPRGWLRSQLQFITELPAVLENTGSSAELILQAREQQRTMRQLQNEPRDNSTQSVLRQLRRTQSENQLSQLGNRLQAAISSPHPFSERLVRFWSNHFTIAVGGGPKQVIRQIALPYENEAIRPQLGGSFSDLLLAVEQHPGMLIYLDNAGSTGPRSQLGRRRDRGLNENLAREILELHTLGVNGGYGQGDVTALAEIITGWTVDQGQPGRAALSGSRNAGSFRFVPAMHEPGVHRLLQKDYREDGVAQGEKALRDLAVHPATARHLAHKLVKHFVADVPPAAAVNRLEQVFLDTSGSLPALHGALIELEEAWDPAYRKLKTAEELIVSVARACNLETGNPGSAVTRLLLQAQQILGQVPFTASSPAGWADEADIWGSPDALLKRIDWVHALVQVMPQNLDPLQLYEQVLPAEQNLLQVLQRAESVSQGMSLLFASPQFQWRGV